MGDRGDNDFYRVESAFNGAVLYPLELVRSSGAKYDAGTDGQRCEHIGFNLSLKNEMFVNRKWDMLLDPSQPGGPTGWRAKKTLLRVQETGISFSLFLQVFLCTLIFIHSIMSLGLYIVFPVLSGFRCIISPLIPAKFWRSQRQHL